MLSSLDELILHRKTNAILQKAFVLRFYSEFLKKAASVVKRRMTENSLQVISNIFTVNASVLAPLILSNVMTPWGILS